jgi:hypothetical protein
MTNQFQVGRTYSVRSICDSECIFRFEVVKRTAKTVWLKSGSKVKARRVREWDGAEACDPHGRYSMSPILSARD